MQRNSLRKSLIFNKKKLRLLNKLCFDLNLIHNPIIKHLNYGVTIEYTSEHKLNYIRVNNVTVLLTDVKYWK